MQRLIVTGVLASVLAAFSSATAAGTPPLATLVSLTSLVPAPQAQADRTVYRVVINHEEQYSIWPADRALPIGWSDAGKTGSKQECLDYIQEVWTDMRPQSLRALRDGTGLPQEPAASPEPSADPAEGAAEAGEEAEDAVEEEDYFEEEEVAASSSRGVPASRSHG